MLIFHGPRLVMFSIPRTGSTSLHAALRPFADIEFSNPPGKKHMAVRRFEKWCAENDPEIAAYTRAAVLRDPLARIESWYRYRRRDGLKGHENSAQGFTFDAYVEATLLDDPPPPARVGNQHRFLTRPDGSLGVDELFCLEKPRVLTDYLTRIFGPIDLPHRNAAPDEPTPLDQDIEQRLRAARAPEFDLFSRVQPTGRLSLPRA